MKPFLLSLSDSMFFYTHRYIQEILLWTIKVKSTGFGLVSLCKNKNIAVRMQQNHLQTLSVSGMIANIFQIIVICYAQLNQEYFSKVTVIIMFIVINKKPRKSETGTPWKKRKCRILIRGRKLRGINRECWKLEEIQDEEKIGTEVCYFRC